MKRKRENMREFLKPFSCWTEIRPVESCFILVRKEKARKEYLNVLVKVKVW